MKKRIYEQVAGEVPPGGGPPVTDSQPAKDPTPPAVQATNLAQGVAATGDDWLPEKFRTQKADGTGLDVDASARKLAQSYAELEKRGNGPREGVPATAAEYTIDLKSVPDTIDAASITSDPLFKSFLDTAHAHGMTNEQVNATMAQYFQIMPQVLGAQLQTDATAARSTLTKEWGEGNLDANLKSAVRAVQGFGGEPGKLGNVDTLMVKFGNDPDFLALMNRIGAEMSEDVPIQGDAASMQSWQDQANAIRMSDAYKDKNHIEHGKAVKQMEDLYTRRYGTKKAFRGTAQ